MHSGLEKIIKKLKHPSVYVPSIGFPLNELYLSLPFIKGDPKPGSDPGFIILSAIAGLAWFEVGRALRGIDHFNKPRAVRLFSEPIRETLNSLLGDRAAREYFRFQRDYSDSSPKKDLSMAVEAIKYGDYSKALDHMKIWLEKYSTDPIFQNLLSSQKRKKPLLKRGLRSRLFEEMDKQNREENPALPYFQNLIYALYALARNDVDKSADYFGQALKTEYAQPETSLGMGLLLLNLGKEEEAGRIIHYVLSHNLGMLDSFEKVPGSNRVMRSRDPLYGRVLLSKQATDSSLKIEQQRIKSLEQKIIQRGLGRTIGTGKFLGTYALSAENQPSKSFTLAFAAYEEGILQIDAFNRDFEAMKDSAFANGLLHALMTDRKVDDPGIALHKNAFMKKLSGNATISENIKAGLHDNIDVCFKFYEKYPYLVDDNDLNPHQAILKPTKIGMTNAYKIIFIDMEQKGIEGMNGYNRMESDDAKNWLFGPYILKHENSLLDGISKLSQEKMLAFRNFSIPEIKMDYKSEITYPLSVLLASVPKSLTYLLYTHTLENPRLDADGFLSNARTAIDELLDRKSGYFKIGDVKHLQKLQQQLALVQIENKAYLESRNMA